MKRKRKTIVDMPLRAARAANGISQSELVEILIDLNAGCNTRLYLGLLENNEMIPTVTLASMLNHYFNIDCKGMLGEDKVVAIKFSYYKINKQIISHEEYMKKYFSHHRV